VISTAADTRKPRQASTTPLVETVALRKTFPIEHGLSRRARGHVLAVDGVDLAVHVGTTTGIVGESGSGKSTLGRLVLRLLEPTSGHVFFEGRDITTLSGRELQPVRRNIQVVFQDPYSSFDPSASILGSLREPLHTHLDLSIREQTDRASSLLERVGLSREYLTHYPGELSGGQLQRAAVARALAVQPRLLVLDEPVSSLDVSTQGQVINLFADLQAQLGIAYLFIAHDLSVVRHVSDRIAVMYLGRIVEEGPAEAVYTEPAHPYTEALLSAIPVPNPARQRVRSRIVLSGDIPSPSNPPPGCHFHTRCPYVMDVCRKVDPEPITTRNGTTVFCHLHTSGPELAGASVSGLRPPAASAIG
jgi:oligopeptide/dipeptide ABC transporter ATP-binding protein